MGSLLCTGILYCGQLAQYFNRGMERETGERCNKHICGGFVNNSEKERCVHDTRTEGKRLGRKVTGKINVAYPGEIGMEGGKLGK